MSKNTEQDIDKPEEDLVLPEISDETEQEFGNEDTVNDDIQDDEPVVLRGDDDITDVIAAVISNDDDDDDTWWQDDQTVSQRRKEMTVMYESTFKQFSPNEIVHGAVVSITPKEVVINIGFKSEGIVPVSEFRDTPNLKPGDTVEVFIETIEDRSGQLLLSRRRAKSMRSWETINSALDGDVIIEGTIARRTKGGFVVDLSGIEAFLPGSQIDVKPVRDFDAYVGRTMEFKVVKINHAYENVVVSHKVLIEEKLDEQRQEIIKNLDRGQVLEGTVKNMTNFGVFIDLGGVDGLLHITDISWGRINHPEEVLKLDDKVNVVVLDFDEAKKRISLGMKQLTAHPWDSLPEEVTEGTKLKGKVVTVADYGIFVEIIPGVEGLIHTSEMSYSSHPKSPTELYKVGDEVEAVVLNIDRNERKMSLGIKQLAADPWTTVVDRFPVGSQHTGTVRNMTNFGLFVEMAEGIDGLVHISDLSWTKKFTHPSEFIKTGEKLEVVVLDIDVENRRLSLGHKQLTEDVWETFSTIFMEGTEHEGTIKKMDAKGARVELEYGVEGFVPSRHLRVPDGADALKVDDRKLFTVLEFSKDRKSITLSHTRTWLPEDEDPQEGGNKGGGAKRGGSKASSDKGSDKGGDVKIPTSKQGTTSLGDIDALAQLKAQMEADENK